jgi:hypothetical protein
MMLCLQPFLHSNEVDAHLSMLALLLTSTHFTTSAPAAGWNE